MPHLRYPNKSHRKVIRYPPDGIELAELMGMIFGDGGITDTQIKIHLNANSDRSYSVYVAKLLEKLFRTNVYVMYRQAKNTLVLICSSTNMVNFIECKGAVRGNKMAHQAHIPGWLLANTSYARAFVRGLVDTDGCLYIHKHTVLGHDYRNIGFCFTNYVLPVINSMAEILRASDIKPHITDKNRRIYLYSARSVVKYLSVFKTNNPRISNVYNIWRDGRVDDGTVLERLRRGNSTVGSNPTLSAK
jgi:hypothetical protein